MRSASAVATGATTISLIIFGARVEGAYPTPAAGTGYPPSFCGAKINNPSVPIVHNIYQRHLAAGL